MLKAGQLSADVHARIAWAGSSWAADSTGACDVWCDSFKKIILLLIKATCFCQMHKIN